MKSTAIFVFLFCFAAAKHKEKPTPRILNGKLATVNQFPYQVGLYLFNGVSDYFCGGALIHQEWVLTAASCTAPAISGNVYLGKNEQLKSAIKIKVKEKDMITHAYYDRTTFYNDIALIKIPPVTLSNAIKLIALPKMGSTIYIGSNVTASGWGKSSDESGYFSDMLLYADSEVIANEQCEKFYGIPKINAGKICVDSYRGIALCSGDLGTPLILNNPRVLVGIASMVPTYPCDTNKPSVFTRVPYYQSWIRKKTGLPL